MFKTIAITIVVLLALALAAVLGFATTRPDTFRVRRSVSIEAPREKIFPLINDFHRWRSWSPYEKKDPLMKRTLSGAAKGEGAIYEWQGDHNVGQGRMEIVDASPPSGITIQLDFIKPFEAHDTAEFTLKPKADSTNVTWALHGPMPYVSKVMSVFFDMDKMIGADFEAGLANLKRLAES